jgi:hypothetical protein
MSDKDSNGGLGFFGWVLRISYTLARGGGPLQFCHWHQSNISHAIGTATVQIK